MSDITCRIGKIMTNLVNAYESYLGGILKGDRSVLAKKSGLSLDELNRLSLEPESVSFEVWLAVFESWTEKTLPSKVLETTLPEQLLAVIHSGSHLSNCKIFKGIDSNLASPNIADSNYKEGISIQLDMFQEIKTAGVVDNLPEFNVALENLMQQPLLASIKDWVTCWECVRIASDVIDRMLPLGALLNSQADIELKKWAQWSQENPEKLEIIKDHP
jgi:hypothetical protein